MWKRLDVAGRTVDDGREMSLPKAAESGRGESPRYPSLLDVLYSSNLESLKGVEAGR